jgi:hypothetical protein
VNWVAGILFQVQTKGRHKESSAGYPQEQATSHARGLPVLWD